MANFNLSAEDEVKARIAIKLAGLGVKASYLRTENGPVVNTVYYQLGFETPISKIINRSEDIAIACGVERVLIFRKGGEIAIEIPNVNRATISFDTCLFQLFQSNQAKKLNLPLMLGVDSHGASFNLDLVEQPHVLVAGSTGGGKSVLLSSIIGALAITKQPTEARLILVDTKKLDLPLFENLPHVIDNVENVEEFHRAMDRLMNIVRKRTDKIKGIARNITEYNSLMPAGQKLPYFVMLIDELADLIDEDSTRSKLDEDYRSKYQRVPQRIKHLIQICRAVGVHIIAATQRSSVKVISGDIKANFPTRIALRLPTRADSATILSGGGAENLLGKGDMLVESPAFAQLQRAHGAFVSNEDIARILADAPLIREQLLALA
jgi:S-DNA-T family DNA segregation ATPase FtsK/SpoIIIE